MHRVNPGTTMTLPQPSSQGSTLACLLLATVTITGFATQPHKYLQDIERAVLLLSSMHLVRIFDALTAAPRTALDWPPVPLFVNAITTNTDQMFGPWYDEELTYT